MSRLGLIFLLFSVFTACGDKLDCDIDFDVPFPIEVGEEYCLPGGLVLLISDISSSYCPCDATCFWQGETVVSGSLTDIDAVATIMIHEVLEAQNLPWIAIHNIALSETCEPEVERIELIISDPRTTSSCNGLAEIDEGLYSEGPNDFIKIIAASIVDDCLTISYSASGCSGDSWEVNLYDSGDIAESEPEQRYLWLSMENPEACLAVFTKEQSFDISNLQIENNGTLILNLEDYGRELRYEY